MVRGDSYAHNRDCDAATPGACEPASCSSRQPGAATKGNADRGSPLRRHNGDYNRLAGTLPTNSLISAKFDVMNVRYQYMLEGDLKLEAELPETYSGNKRISGVLSSTQ